MCFFNSQTASLEPRTIFQRTIYPNSIPRSRGADFYGTAKLGLSSFMIGPLTPRMIRKALGPLIVCRGRDDRGNFC